MEMRNIKMAAEEYFTVQVDLILLDGPLPYNLYINSAGDSGRVKFIRVFPRGDILLSDDLKELQRKYVQIYLSDDERDDFVQSLVKSSSVAIEDKTKVVKDSAINYLDKVFDPEKEFSTEVLEETIKGCRKNVENMVDLITDEDLSLSGLQKLIGNLSYHDFYTFDHSVNVSMYTILILKETRPESSKDDLTLAGLGGMLHDIGKVEIPLYIINKAGKLDDEEFAIIQSHPVRGKELIETQKKELQGVDFETIRDVVFQHHENYNGTGYPNKISGEDINFYARIVAVADFFDAVTTKRSYHTPLSLNDAIGIMENTVGKKLDPEIFHALKATVSDIGTIEKSHIILPDDFDACQPHNKLPIKDYDPATQDHNLFEKNKKFGKVKVSKKKGS
ncbi:MAG: hypothetical protein DRQ88_06425 [Epsilonproteobacteria bacterium]|nr:MAG: hypothetical protein DRQ89_04865 [Campylobacterota bacterium]RLA66432.1 MAG: hypothetical protein DRQ88_06425 [Campylobacterota bacterium]